MPLARPTKNMALITHCASGAATLRLIETHLAGGIASVFSFKGKTGDGESQKNILTV
jgi:hypothetical protein